MRQTIFVGVLGLALLCVVAGLVWVGARLSSEAVVHRHNLSEQMRACFAAGYPDYRFSGDEAFCMRKMNGNDEIIHVSKVRR